MTWDDIVEAYQALQARLDVLETQVPVLEGRVAELEGQVAVLSARADATDDTLAVHDAQIENVIQVCCNG